MAGELQSATFRSVLPHEPLPPSESLGFVHIQGAFVPRLFPTPNDTVENDEVGEDDEVQNDVDPHLPFTANVIESALLRSLTLTMEKESTKNRFLGLNHSARDVNVDQSLTKARITYDCPRAARDAVSFFRGSKITPADLLRDSMLVSVADSSSPINGIDSDNAMLLNGVQYRFSARPIQATQITSCPLAAAPDVRWTRANPPKFRRLLLRDALAGGRAGSESLAELEQKRRQTRFVFITGIIDYEDHGSDVPYHAPHGGGDAGAGECKSTPSPFLNDQHAFIDALRSVLDPYDTSGFGVELFVPSNNKKSAHKFCHVGMRSHADAERLVVDLQGQFIHLPFSKPDGTPSKVKSGKLFLDYADVTHRSYKNAKKRGEEIDGGNDAAHPRGPPRSECTSTTDSVTVPGLILVPDFVSEDEEAVLMAALTGPDAPWAPSQVNPSKTGTVKRRVQHYGYVFDYETAGVLRNRSAEGASCPPLPSILSPGGGVSVMHDNLECYVAHAVEERRGWETLAGVIERARRTDFPQTAVNNSSLPSLLNSTKDICSDSDHIKLADCVETSQHEQVRKFKTTPEPEDTMKFPDLNQLTVNEYCPGQGIGSHIDTPSAFSDGILSLSLNGGVVMEFRHALPCGPSKARALAANSEHREECRNVETSTEKTTEGSDATQSVAHKTLEKSKQGDNNGKKLRKLVYLPPRSLLIMSGNARYEWEHGIVTRMTDTVNGKILPRKLRVSLTLRTALCAPPLGHLPLDRIETNEFPPQWEEGKSDSLSTENATPSLSGKVNAGNELESTLSQAEIATPATEKNHVHAVYDAIATQWHHTRGKRGVLWPGATQFLQELPAGSVVADVGCGDGKYFPAIWEAGSYVIGTDISLPLLRTSIRAGTDGGVIPKNRQVGDKKSHLNERPAIAVGDCMHVPLRTHSCDAAICIAVMHHLSTVGRRIRCLSELSRVVKVGGTINVQAWAIDQEQGSKRRFAGTDVFVPFNAQPRYLDKVETNGGHCHKQKLKSIDLIGESTGDKNKNASDAEANQSEGAMGVAQMYSEAYKGVEFDECKGLVVFKRYCHLYRKGELEELVTCVKNLDVVESGYESGNYFLILRVTK